MRKSKSESKCNFEKIYDYQMTTELTNKNSGFARWGFAEKDGKEYFIKEFLAPVYPEEKLAISEDERNRRKAECQQFFEEKNRLYSAIRVANNGNIIQIEDFFRHKTHFYVVTDKVDQASLDIAQVAKLPEMKKELLLKVLTHCLKNLSVRGVVHGDLKPDNILIKETISGFYTVKLIDFDSSFFETREFSEDDDIQGDTVYLAPETFLCMVGACDRITVKADVFALGILFHQYLSGEFPEFSAEYDYMYEVALDDAAYRLSPKIPEKYQTLIRRMLEKEPEKRISIEEVLDELTGVKQKEKEVKAEPVKRYDPMTGEKLDVSDADDKTKTAKKDEASGDGWLTNVEDSWGTNKTFDTKGPDSAPKGKFDAYEPGVTNIKKQSPVMVNGLKISGNLRKS